MTRRKTEPRMAFVERVPQQSDGTLTTTRLGDKWVKLWLDGWRLARMLDEDGKPVGRLEMLDVKYGPLRAMSPEDLRGDATGDMPDHAMTAEMLEHTYAKSVGPNTYVTLITFRVFEGV